MSPRPPDGTGPVLRPAPERTHRPSSPDGGFRDSASRVDSAPDGRPRPHAQRPARDAPPRPPTSPGCTPPTRAAWDEAAERYEGWFDEAVELIRAGGSNLFPVEHDLIGDLHGRCRRAIHLQCAGGRDTLSLWNLGARRGRRRRHQPAHARARGAAHRGDRCAGALDRVPTSSTRRTTSTAPPTSLYTGRGAIMWLQDLDAWAAVLRRLLAPAGRLVIFDGHPAEWLFDADEDGHWILTDYDYFGGPEASRGWAPEYIDRLSIPEDDQQLEVRPGVDAGRDRDGAAGRRAAPRARHRAPGRLVGRPPGRPSRGARSRAAVVLGRGDPGRLAGESPGGVAGPGSVDMANDEGQAVAALTGSQPGSGSPNLPRR